MQIDDVRKKFGRFRVLIMGRANAGKTTILKKICNSTEDPEIYDDQGKKVWSHIVLLVPTGIETGDQLDPARIQESAGVSTSGTVGLVVRVVCG